MIQALLSIQIFNLISHSMDKKIQKTLLQQPVITVWDLKFSTITNLYSNSKKKKTFSRNKAITQVLKKEKKKLFKVQFMPRVVDLDLIQNINADLGVQTRDIILGPPVAAAAAAAEEAAPPMNEKRPGPPDVSCSSRNRSSGILNEP